MKKVECAVVAVLAALALNCGGDKPPAQDPSTTPTASTDADAAAPASTVTTQPTK